MVNQINLKTLHIATSIQEAQKKYGQDLNDLRKYNTLSDDFLFKNRTLIFHKIPEHTVSSNGFALVYPRTFSLRVSLFQIELIFRFFKRMGYFFNQMEFELTNHNNELSYCFQIKHPVLIWEDPNAYELITPENPFMPEFQITSDQIIGLSAKISSQLALNEKELFLSKKHEDLNFIKILSYEIGMIVKENKKIQIESLQKNMYHAILRNQDELMTQIEDLMELLKT